MKARLSNFVAFDLGSSKIAAIAAIVDKKGEVRIVSQSLYHSHGFKSGIVTDLKKAEASIINAIYALEKDCSKNVKQIALSLSGVGTKSYYTYSKIKIPEQQISKQDVKKLIHKNLSEFKMKDQEIIHYFPVEFTVDDNTCVDNPIGMFGKELSCQLHIVCVNSALLSNLTNCFIKCQVEISDVNLAIYASGIACLSEEEKNLGTFIIDMGAFTTSYGVFLFDKLIYTSYVSMGSHNITADIAKIFSVSLDAAEKLKVLYGSAVLSTLDKNSTISIEDIEPDNPYNTVSSIATAQLTAVIHARAEEIFLLIKEQYDKVGIDHMLARRLVITGGGATLRGMKELAGQVFEKQVRIAKPIILPGFKEDYNPSIYSTAIGMIKNYSMKQQKNSIEGDLNEGTSSWLKKTLKWLRENI